MGLPQSKILNPLQSIIDFMIKKQQDHIAKQFNDDLNQHGIKNYQQLVEFVVDGQFRKFKKLYYKYLSQPQRIQFKNDYQKLIFNNQLIIRFIYQINQSDINHLNIFKREFYILVIGITGNGKTTYINSLYNALTIQSKKRYLQCGIRKLLVDDQQKQLTGESVTKEIKSYSFMINHNSDIFRINIIDTPGLNDTSGLQQDQTMIDQLGNYLLQKVSHLDLILLVSKEQEIYTFQEELSMQSIVKLLGIDTPKYTKQILTFSELQQNIQRDKFNQRTLKVFYDNQQEPKYHQFQNSLMFIQGKVNQKQKRILQINLHNLKKLIGGKFLNKPNSDFLNLSITQKANQRIFILVGQEFRRQLIANMNNKLFFDSYQNQVNFCSNFSFKQQVIERKETQCQEGYTTTYCLKCKITCHDRCEIENEKAGCIVFRNKICFSINCGHSVSDHQSLSTVIKNERVVKTFEFSDVKKQYHEALTLKKYLQLKIDNLNIEQKNLREQICIILAAVKLRDQELRKSALFHDVTSKADEFYINEIKKQYQQEKKFTKEIELTYQKYMNSENCYIQMAQKQLKEIVEE